MSKPTNRYLIGGFVLGALVLMVAGVVILGSGRFFSEMNKGVLYFDGSVKGLSVGAPVMFRGVKIGSVTGISLRFDPATLKIQIPVFIETVKERADRNGALVTSPAKTLKLLVEKGLRAKLELQSFVTGQLMISLDFRPDEPARFVGDGSQLEIPTIPSSMEQLAKTIDKLPLEELVNRLTSVAAGMDRLLNAPELAQSIATLSDTLKDFQRMFRDANAQISPIGSSVQETVRDAQRLVRRVEGQVDPISANLQKALEDTRKLVGHVDAFVDPFYVGMMDVIKQAGIAIKKVETTIAEVGEGTNRDSELVVGLVDSFNEFEKAARAVRGLAEYLERHPEALLRGKGTPWGK
jgi:paraquat-inducible protein B